MDSRSEGVDSGAEGMDSRSEGVDSGAEGVDSHASSMRGAVSFRELANLL
jgi:hypothetical protein